MSCHDFGESPVGAPVSGVTAFDSAAPKSRIELRARVPWPVEPRKNEVRRKLECHEDSMSCHDFGEPPVGAPASGMTAFDSAAPKSRIEYGRGCRAAMPEARGVRMS
jgi:hypothetical protein